VLSVSVGLGMEFRRIQYARHCVSNPEFFQKLSFTVNCPLLIDPLRPLPSLWPLRETKSLHIESHIDYPVVGHESVVNWWVCWWVIG